MTSRVLPLRASTHRVVDAMLPWYVNGTLSADEHALVRGHLDECATCRREAGWLRELHAACATCAEQGQAAEFFSRLQQRSQARASGARVAQGSAWRALPPVWKAAAVAQLALIALLGFAVMRGDDGSPLYRTLGRASTVTSGNLVVTFDVATSEADLRRALRDADARIVDGPTRANAYVLAVPAAEQAQALARLRASPNVTLVQPLDAQGVR